MLPLAIVVAMTPQRVIGKNGALPWHIPEDLRHFRDITTGHAIVMGRRTFESIGRALPNRTNIVITRDPTFHQPSCQIANSFDDAIALARTVDSVPRVIGGTQLFARALPIATELHMTLVNDGHYDGDIYFPPFDLTDWRETHRQLGETPGIEFIEYERVRVSPSS